jgi:hypothetical protein
MCALRIPNIPERSDTAFCFSQSLLFLQELLRCSPTCQPSKNIEEMNIGKERVERLFRSLPSIVALAQDVSIEIYPPPPRMSNQPRQDGFSSQKTHTIASEARFRAQMLTYFFRLFPVGKSLRNLGPAAPAR